MAADVLKPWLTAASVSNGLVNVVCSILMSHRLDQRINNQRQHTSHLPSNYKSGWPGRLAYRD